MLTARTLRGNWATLLLPINADESIDYARLEEELDRMILAVPDGVYSNGTAGELHNQTEKEFDKVQEIMAAKCQAAGVLFQIGANHPSPLVSLQRMQRMVALKPAAFQVILPDWVTTGPGEQVSFLQKMAEAADGIPLVLYNPPHAKKVLHPAEYGRLQEIVPSLIGIKVAGGDAAWYDEMRVYANSLSVFVPGHFLATGVQEGVAAGAYSNVACISPQGAQWWWRLMHADLAKALDVQKRILQFFDTCIVPYKNAGYSNPALDKFLAAVGGWANIGTRLRWPYKWIPEEEVSGASVVCRKLLPEFFEGERS
ncbi:dihydrodipicolinate synthase family protein [Paraflavitalea soli]|uniref:Dihydrodipicolinate synthase family protein n=1 Tax=Paraflavitalea soli TaxID=2315862 RepID=A0A3B7MEB7_9BACT|nr:dihydrodipicolinate synthase family protein [Paraflavitalea soli]AXY72622.1 dihydrodipicolinate synthase family protein [Paraflavitalea soli]